MKIEITPREQYAVAIVVLGNIQPKDRTERRLFKRLVDELGLRKYAEQSATGPLNFRSDHPDEPFDVDLSGAVVDFFLDRTEKLQLAGAFVPTFSDVEERIIDAKNASKG